MPDPTKLLNPNDDPDLEIPGLSGPLGEVVPLGLEAPEKLPVDFPDDL